MGHVERHRTPRRRGAPSCRHDAALLRRTRRAAAVRGVGAAHARRAHARSLWLALPQRHAHALHAGQPSGQRAARGADRAARGDRHRGAPRARGAAGRGALGGSDALLRLLPRRRAHAARRAAAATRGACRRRTRDGRPASGLATARGRRLRLRARRARRCGRERAAAGRLPAEDGRAERDAAAADLSDVALPAAIPRAHRRHEHRLGAACGHGGDTRRRQLLLRRARHRDRGR